MDVSYVMSVDVYNLISFHALIQEGCQFSLDVVTCFQFKGRSVAATKGGYESL